MCLFETRSLCVLSGTRISSPIWLIITLSLSESGSLGSIVSFSRADLTPQRNGEWDAGGPVSAARLGNGSGSICGEGLSVCEARLGRGQERHHEAYVWRPDPRFCFHIFRSCLGCRRSVLCLHLGDGRHDEELRCQATICGESFAEISKRRHLCTNFHVAMFARSMLLSRRRLDRQNGLSDLIRLTAHILRFSRSSGSFSNIASKRMLDPVRVFLPVAILQ
jgi:hypothetical protein